jgi:hypothetical protein
MEGDGMRLKGKFGGWKVWTYCPWADASDDGKGFCGHYDYLRSFYLIPSMG